MGRQVVRVLGQDYTKTGFEKKWTEIVQSTECNYFGKSPDADFVHEVVGKIDKWKTLHARQGIRYKIRNKKFQGRAVRGIVIITPRSKVIAALTPLVILVSIKVKKTGPTIKASPKPSKIALKYSFNIIDV